MSAKKPTKAEAQVAEWHAEGVPVGQEWAEALTEPATRYEVGLAADKAYPQPSGGAAIEVFEAYNRSQGFFDGALEVVQRRWPAQVEEGNEVPEQGQEEQS